MSEIKNIRQATKEDVYRISEIEIFNYRINFYPIFKDDWFYFSNLNVISKSNEYLEDEKIFKNIYVYDDGAIKGFIRIEGNELKKLFVEPVLQGQNIGSKLLEYAVKNHNVSHLWALEKNEKAIKFYQRNGFNVTDDKILEEGSTEYLVKLKL